MHIVQALIKGSVGPYYFLFVIGGLYLIVPFLQLILNTFSKRSLTILVGALFCHVALLYFCNRIVENTVSFSSSLTLFLPYIGYFLAGGYFKKYPISTKNKYQYFFSFIILGLCVAVLNYITAVAEMNKIVFLSTFLWNQYFYEPFNPMMILMSIFLFSFIISLNFRFSSIQKKILTSLSSAIFCWTISILTIKAGCS
jgi:surface polysaccharide O-acyltransferase-like enzyme